MSSAIDDRSAIDEVGLESRIQVRAPASQLAQALMSVVHIADAKDESATHDTVRVEATELGALVVSASNPQMLAACIVPDGEAMATGAVEITPAVAKELAGVCKAAAASGWGVDVLLVHVADAVELEVLEGLPICVHRTRRPLAVLRDGADTVFDAVRAAGGESEDVLNAAMAVADGYGDEADLDVPETGVSLSSSQLVSLAKSAKAVSTPMQILPTRTDGRYWCRAGSFAAVWTERGPEDGDAEGGDEGTAAAEGPVVDGAAGNVDADDHDDEELLDEASATPGLRVVESRPIGGLS